jgi:hypothetical protein
MHEPPQDMRARHLAGKHEELSIAVCASTVSLSPII